MCRMALKSEDGRELRTFWFKDEDESQEVLAVEMRILLETLANQLAPESVQFSSKLATIETSANGETLWNWWMEVSYLLIDIGIGCQRTHRPKITDPAALKKQAKDLVRHWPAELLTIIDVTPDDTIIRTPVDHWLWPAISPPASRGRVVLVGDAWHLMTRNVGQGACCSLEDAVVLARKLANATRSGTASVEEALRSYGSERWPRIFPLTIWANLVGSLLQWENSVVCSVRNSLVIPKLIRLGTVLENTNFYGKPPLEGLKVHDFR